MRSSTPGKLLHAGETKSEQKKYPLSPPKKPDYFLILNELSLNTELYKKGIIFFNKPTDEQSLTSAANTTTPDSFNIGNEVFKIGTKQQLLTEIPDSKEVFSSTDSLFDKLQFLSLLREPQWNEIIPGLFQAYHTIELTCAGFFNHLLIDTQITRSNHGFIQQQNPYTTVRFLVQLIQDYVEYLDDLSIVYRMSIPYNNFHSANSDSAKLSPRRYIPSYNRSRAIPFTPFIMTNGITRDGLPDKIALRLSPSIYARNEEDSEYHSTIFDEFFITASMFGANLKGITKQGSKIPLLDSEISLPPNDEIVDIEYSSPNFFERTQLNTLRAAGLLMKRLGSASAQVYCQLKSTEYEIHALFLYFTKRMSLDALKKIIDMIEIKKCAIIDELTHLFTELDIKLMIFSPFDNLIPTHNENEQISRVMSIFRNLQLDTLKPNLSNQRQTEKTIIEAYITAVLSNTAHARYTGIWNDLAETLAKRAYHLERISLSHLYQMANVAGLVIVSYEKPPNSVCHIQLCSEIKMQEMAYFYFKHSPLVHNPVLTIQLLDLCFARENNLSIQRNHEATTFHFQDSETQYTAYSLMAHQAFFQESLRNAARSTPTTAEEVLNQHPISSIKIGVSSQ